MLQFHTEILHVNLGLACNFGLVVIDKLSVTLGVLNHQSGEADFVQYMTDDKEDAVVQKENFRLMCDKCFISESNLPVLGIILGIVQQEKRVTLTLDAFSNLLSTVRTKYLES